MEKKRGDFVMSEEKFEENSTSQDMRHHRITAHQR